MDRSTLTIAVAVFKTFSAGEVLTASDLNNSLTRIIDNQGSLGWPRTASADMDGYEFILDADGDTSITSDTDDQIDFRLNGTDYFRMAAGRMSMLAAHLALAEGAAVASATTTDIWTADGNTRHITGTTTITGFGTAPQAGASMWVIFDGALTLTHGANLNLPGSANITTAADDFAFVYADTTTQFDVLYFRKDGTPVVFGGAAATDITMSGAMLIEAEGAAIASGTTTDIWVTDGNTCHITGTTTITSLGTAPQAGAWKKVIFDGALVLTHGANLSLPGSANITTAADDVAFVYADTTTQFDVLFFPKAGAKKPGLETICIPAAAMTPTVSNGCASLTKVETTAGRPDMVVLDFDATADEHAQFVVTFPKSWNEGTVTFQVFHTTTATDTDGVAWGLQGVACSDGDTIDVAYGTPIVVTDAYQSTAEDMYVTAVSSAVTIGGTPAAGDAVYFRVFRDVSDAADTATEDARLIAVKLFFTTDAPDDT